MKKIEQERKKGTIQGKNETGTTKDDYPNNGEKDGVWYVYLGVQ